jgi:hypothetical protein
VEESIGLAGSEGEAMSVVSGTYFAWPWAVTYAEVTE